MNQQIQVGTAIFFMLKREYVRECVIEPAKNEDGTDQFDANGQTFDRAIHPMNLTFEQWLESNEIIVKTKPESLIKTKPFQILKP